MIKKIKDEMQVISVFFSPVYLPFLHALLYPYFSLSSQPPCFPVSLPKRLAPVLNIFLINLFHL